MSCGGEARATDLEAGTSEGGPRPSCQGQEVLSCGRGVYARNYAGGPTWLEGMIVETQEPLSFWIELRDGRIRANATKIDGPTSEPCEVEADAADLMPSPSAEPPNEPARCCLTQRQDFAVQAECDFHQIASCELFNPRGKECSSYRTWVFSIPVCVTFLYPVLFLVILM